ncbi:MAG: hypothetical protein NT029_17915 [Armatimonadetes bacterium]|nr:hypothetical protein [Armatimonadota bacterium]
MVATWVPAAGAVLAAMTMATAAASQVRRSLPEPLPERPGNVFLVGEEARVKLPPSSSSWRLTDYEGRTLRTVEAAASVALGKLDAGFYRLEREGADWVSLAVLPRLKAPTPTTSPICIDTAMSWFYPADRMPAVYSLAALAGVNRTRDRLTWGNMEPSRGTFAGPTQYDASADAAARAGLQSLQVMHGSPAWAGPVGKRFPPDLRDAYRFWKAMAKRWAGKVQAFEPWNEADIDGFGGHTGAEMAALQKASYLGVRAGNPAATACLNVFAFHNRNQLQDLADNMAWPYFDTYNLHHYEGLAGYPRLYADHRAVSAGRPMWVTECAMPVQFTGSPDRQELTDETLRDQSERIAKVFAASLHQGSAATYYFILGHYVEGQTQFGIVRKDLTPRPAYVALAAVGRLLADAKPLGRVGAFDAPAEAYAFSAKPDGKPAVVVVAWAREGRATLALPAQPTAAYDHLGRPASAAREVELTAAPRFVLLPVSAAGALSATPAPPAPARLAGKPSSVVLQALWPDGSANLSVSAHKLPATDAPSVPVFVYNFGAKTVSGTLRATGPAGWKVTPSIERLTVPPMGRVEVRLTIDTGAGAVRTVEKVRVEGAFGPAGKATLAFRVAPERSALAGLAGPALRGAGEQAAWSSMVSGDGRMSVTVEADGGILVDAEPGGADKWAYPKLDLPKPNGALTGADALACDVELLEGAGTFRAIFDEANGASYVVDLMPQPAPGARVKTVGLLESVIHGAVWSKYDPNQRLDLPDVASLKVGVNAGTTRVRYRIRNLRWVRAQK